MKYLTLKTATAFIATAVLSVTGLPRSESYAEASAEPRATIVAPSMHPSFKRPQPPWMLPVAPTPQIYRPFVAPSTPYSAGHRGVDFVVADRQQLRAPADGVIHFQGTVVDRPVVSIRHADGYISSFEPAQSSLVQGDSVAAGQPFGEIRHDLSENAHCASGHDTHPDRAPVNFTHESAIAPCLHVGARLNGEYVNPMILFGLVSRPILLPLSDR
ncbi:M23 family metallopeptidase [Lysinibacter cavernae]|uniref:Murein DD-endopeptidase MepM/ murein hydrolase activator NlpD n=2 Tax=Lysinibacter cavernae TaxID=1640652 RepID=A0A7X5QYP5_9MICO|nr:murein DD-endopeptidase MepM/ murein hydrolase activator NlpD [Lysinibacter cavernae]